MKGLVYEGPEVLRFSTVDDPSPHDTGGAVVKVTACGICGSDLHIYHGHTVRETGFCIGHEAIGEVIETGGAVRRWKTGDRVLIPGGIYCDGTCDGCKDGTGCWMPAGAVFGLGKRLQGSQAEAVAVPVADHNLLRIPDGVSDDNALLLTDCAMTAWYGVHKAKVPMGGTVAVIGCGPIGLVAVMAAHLHGAALVFAIDPVADRRRRATELGAIALHPDDARDAILTATGRGVDSVVEAVGSDETIDAALRIVKPRGAVSVIGVTWSKRFSYPLARAQMLSIDFHIGLAVPVDLPAMFELIAAGRFDPSVVISHRLPLSAGPEAYELFANRDDDVCKVVLDPAS